MFLAAIIVSGISSGLLFMSGMKYRSVLVLVASMFFSMIYVGRPLMIDFGMNTVAPGHFDDLSANGALACLSAALFCAMANLTYIAAHKTLRPIGVSLTPRNSLRFSRISLIASITFTLLSVALAVSILSRYGSVQGALYASKISKEMQGTFAQRQVVALGAFFCLVTALNFFCDEKKRWGMSLVFFALAGLNLFTFSLWGTRLEVFVMISGAALFMMSKNGNITPKSVLNFALFGVGLLSVATYLYMLRLSQLSGSWEVVFSRDIFTTTAISLHMTRFDSLMLVHQDFSNPSQWRGGVDFFNGLIMSIPRSIWPGKPDDLLIGQWFRRFYEPAAINGWTVGGPGEYLINFGWFGLVLGGAIWGAILSILDAGLRYRIGQSTPLGVMLAFVLTLIVLPEGSIIQVIPRIILWVVPIWFVILLGNARPFPGVKLSKV